MGGESRAGRRRVQIGAWTLFCDIAGQVSPTPDNPIVTVAAVGVPREVVRPQRARLRQRFQGQPLKWKHGGLAGAQRVVDLIVEARLPVAVTQIHSNPREWARYFEQARAFAEEAQRRTQERMAYLEGDTILRMFLLASGFATLTGRILRARHPWGDQPVTLDLELVADTDLRGAESQERFCDWLIYWSQASSLVTELGVSHAIVARCETEESEPLLLLPDYLAGLYHHADPRTRLAHPVVTPREASEVVQSFRQRHGAALYENPEEFDEQYPLDHQRGRVVPRARL